MDRRQMLTALGGAAVSLPFLLDGGAAAAVASVTSLGATITGIERRVGGRLGVAVLDTATGHRFDHRGGERFPMCSTFKFVLVTAVLHAAERGELSLTRSVPIAARDIVANSPETQRHAGGSLTVVELCRATMTVSDNAAANLLLPLVGGPEGVTRYVRSLGDPITRVDGSEPGLGDGSDERDSTSPVAMLATMRRVLLGSALTPPMRRTLTDWMIGNRNGTTRLRAGFPHGWRAGDKTGTGDHGTANDIAIAWPRPRRAPILITAYLHHSGAEQDRAYRALAEVGRAVAAAVRD